MNEYASNHRKTFSQTQMEALMNVAEAVNSTLDLSELLQLTLKESINAVRDADGGVLFLYDPSIDKLICRSFVNFSRVVENIRLDPDESFTGKCFTSREPVLLTSLSGIDAGTKSMSPRNRQLLDDSLAKHPHQNAHRAMSVPLITENDECIGVITLNGFDEEGTFTEEDLRLLQAVAGQAAIALAKARLHEDLKAKTEKLEQILTYQQKLLLNMNAGRGLEEMLKQLSRQLEKPLSLLTIYGGHLQAGKQNPEYETVEFPVQNGRQLLGKLFIYVKPGQELSNADSYFIQQSVLFFVLEINREATIREVEHRFKSELMEDLLAGMLTEKFIKRAEGLGLNVSRHFLPVTAEASYPAKQDTVNEFIWKNELANLFQVEVNQRFPGSIVVQKEQYFILLLSVEETLPKTQLTEKIRRTAAEIQRFMNQQRTDTAIRFGIGRRVRHIEELPDSIEDSIKVLQIMRMTGMKENVAESTSLGFERLLIPNKDKDIEAFIMATLGPVIQHDQDRDTELVKTLIAYTRHLQRPGQAAKELHIHLNTLHYRLKRISELLDINLHNPDELLNVQLACKLLRR